MKQEEIDNLKISNMFKLKFGDIDNIFDPNDFLFDVDDNDYDYLKELFISNYIETGDEYIDGVKKNLLFKINNDEYVLLYRTRPAKLWETNYGENSKKRCVLISKNVVKLEPGTSLYKKILPIIRKQKIKTIINYIS